MRVLLRSTIVNGVVFFLNKQKQKNCHSADNYYKGYIPQSVLQAHHNQSQWQYGPLKNKKVKM